MKYIEGAGSVNPLPRLNGVSRPLAFELSRFFRYHQPRELGRLYYNRSTTTYTDPNTGDLHPCYPNLQLDFVGRPNSECVRNVLSMSASTMDDLNLLYQTEMYTSKRKGPDPHFDTWIDKQIRTFFSYGFNILEKEPQQVSTKPYTPCLAYFDMEKVKPGPMPHWDNFLSQFEPGEAEVFGAFVFSCIDLVNEGRQLLYLYDNGLTGKSSVANVLMQKLPDLVMGASSALADDRWFYSDVYGKRLVILSDCKNPNIVRSEKLHALTGGDPVSIEFKHLNKFTAKIYSRIIVMSNMAPMIDSYREHEKTRLIPLKLDRTKCKDRTHFDEKGNFIGNNNFIEDLSKEFWHFMHWAKQCYVKLCPNRREIIVPQHIHDNAISEREDYFETLLSEYFILAPNASLPAADLQRKLEEVVDTKFWNGSYFVSNFKQFLSHKGVDYRRTKTGRYYDGISLKTAYCAEDIDQGSINELS